MNPFSVAASPVLVLAHVAGLIDMVALPLWVGGLIQYYGLNAAQAGLTVTLFLGGAVVSSVVLAPRFNRIPARLAVAVGYALAAVAFFAISRQPLSPDSLATLATLHVAAGLCVGCALSFTHGSFALRPNPHRLMAIGGVVLGLFAIIFMIFVPPLIQSHGIDRLFVVIGSSMGFVAILAAAAFPSSAASASQARADAPAPPRIPRAAWLVIVAVSCMMVNQAMVFSFVERMGMDRGFGAERVNAVLVVLGFVNLVPGLLASLMQHRLSPVTVGIAGPLVQCAVALVLCNALSYPAFAGAGVLYLAALLFTHPFLFALLTRLDASGRAAAATPAMLMIGSCIGPGLGGVLSQHFGYQALGLAALVFTATAVAAMALVQRGLASDARLPYAGHART